MEKKEFYLTGIEQMKQGNYVTAYHIFSDAIRQYPENADFYSERGVARFHLNDLEGALEDMNKAQELEPDKPYRYSSRAFIKDALKDVHGAISDYKKAIELDPEDDIAYNNLGLLEEKLGFAQMAQSNFSKADELAGTKIRHSTYTDTIEIDEEGEKIFEAFKQELNLQVKEEPSTNYSGLIQKQNIWKMAFSVFHSRQARNNYISYLKNVLRISH